MGTKLVAVSGADGFINIWMEAISKCTVWMRFLTSDALEMYRIFHYVLEKKETQMVDISSMADTHNCLSSSCRYQIDVGFFLVSMFFLFNYF